MKKYIISIFVLALMVPAGMTLAAKVPMVTTASDQVIQLLLQQIHVLQQLVQQLMGQKGEQTSFNNQSTLADYPSNYGFSFKYPAEWEIMPGDSAGTVGIQSPDYYVTTGEESDGMSYIDKLKGAQISVTYNVSPATKNLDELIEFNKMGRGGVLISNSVKKTVAGEQALISDVAVYKNVKGKQLEFIHSGHYIGIEITYGAANYQKVFDQIVSSFKFISSGQTVSDWKTYKNEKYGFQLSYPLNLTKVDPVDGSGSIDGYYCLPGSNVDFYSTSELNANENTDNDVQALINTCVFSKTDPRNPAWKITTVSDPWGDKEKFVDLNWYVLRVRANLGVSDMDKILNSIKLLPGGPEAPHGSGENPA